jgi:CRISPR-associated protein Csb3
MTKLRIPLDPLNPGHFFACCGLFDQSAARAPVVRGRFETNENTPRRAWFVLEGDEPFDLGDVLTEVRDATYAPQTSHPQKAVQPIETSLDGLILDWWLDAFRVETTPLKCWAGQVTTGKLFTDLPQLIDPATEPECLFYAPALTRSKLGIDPRSAWNALDLGFSPDKHNRDSATFPIVEMLGAIGLQGFRPVTSRREAVGYRLWSEPLQASVARLAAFTEMSGLPGAEYQFSIAKRGQSYKFFTFAEAVPRKETDDDE